MFISSAWATEAATTAPEQASGFAAAVVTFAPLVIIFLIFYIVAIRPQQKRMAEYQKQVSTLRRGDRVVTTGGIIGTVHRIDDKNPETEIEIASGVVVKVQKNAIAEILAKTGAVEEKKK